MKWFLLVVTTFTIVSSRPQTLQDGSSSGTDVEIEKQELIELDQEKSTNILKKSLSSITQTPPPHRKIEVDNTREILEKIAAVNQKQGLTKKPMKPSSYFHFPFSYSKSDDNDAQHRDAATKNDGGNLQSNKNARQSSSFFNYHPPGIKNPFGNPIFDYLMMMHKNDDEDKEESNLRFDHDQTGGKYDNDDDAIAGQYIKRKITHQQTYIVPAAAGFMPGSIQQETVPQTVPQNFGMGLQQSPDAANYNKSSFLEKQTIDNIKNIVINSQNSMQPIQQPYYGQNFDQLSSPYNLSPYAYYLRSNAGRQWQWPLAQYFPIVIKDPMMHMFNAVTSMIEYGSQPGAGAAGACKKERPKSPSVEENKLEQQMLIRAGKSSNITESTNSNKKSRHHQSPPIREPQLHEDEFASDDPFDNSKVSDEHLSHDHNKKLFSKDNTGSGVFINKLKVRKGGVAIAGPGGIATAGSGGTAIVGPNGFAYTQPDSLAIAGSGTKVIAVEPSVNLSDIIRGISATNSSASDMSRIGRVVAVGPVIYYNRG